MRGKFVGKGEKLDKLEPFEPERVVGQMLGMGPRDGWAGWDRIDALIPEAELSGLEAELRSQSQGLATYEAEFDHLAELNGPLADKVIQKRVPEPV